MTKLPSKISNKEPILNEKQKLFCEKILMDVMTPRDAYMAVYKVNSKQVASSNAYKLLQNQAVKTELSSLSNQLKALAQMPTHYLVSKAKTLLAICEEDLHDASNRKYYMEALEYLAKTSGAFQHNSTVTKISLDGTKMSFGEWDSNANEPIELIASEEIPGYTRSIPGENLSEESVVDSEDLIEESDDTVDWDPNDEDPDMPF